MTTILESIVADKKVWVAQAKQSFPLEGFKNDIQLSDRDFYSALFATKVLRKNAFILECKKASPSKGLIREDFDVAEIAHTYAPYATITSVLTDTKYFGGDFEFLQMAKSATHTPILCKDFFIDAYQVYLARYKGGDGILLMLSVLDDDTYTALSDLAHSMNMGVLTEVSNEVEAKRASALGAKIIGINNRNLHDLTTDLDRTQVLRSHLPSEAFVVSESGIYTFNDTLKLRPFCDAYLVGSSVMAQDNIDLACRALTLGTNKVCGLRSANDAKIAYENGAMFGGIILVSTSKRFVDIDTAKEIMRASPLTCIGVFQNESVSHVVATVKELKLTFVQLHGDEDDNYIGLFKKHLSDVFVFKAVSIDISDDSFPSVPNKADGYILDSKVGTQSGGTGVKFNWDIIPNAIKGKSLLSGGIGIDQIPEALKVGCLGLDMNSKLENSNAEKQKDLIENAFQRIQIKN